MIVKKCVILTSLLYSLISIFITPQIIYAFQPSPPPHSIDFRWQCPHVTSESPGDRHYLSRYGNQINGYGWEYADDRRLPDPLFVSLDTTGVPDDLTHAGYYNAGVEYLPGNGLITCYYQSTSGYTTFRLFYFPDHASAGVIRTVTADSIMINVVIG